MGGWAELDAVKSQEIIAIGSDLEPLQAVEPNGEARVINRFSQNVLADFDKNRMRLSFDAMREYTQVKSVWIAY